MPLLTVPLTREPRSASSSDSLSISYRVLGNGPVLVLMVPGMCVPASMYDSMAAVLAATSQFTAVVVDNRGMGCSDAPPASFLGGRGYSVRDLAADAWQVVDAVFEASRITQQKGAHATMEESHHDVDEDELPQSWSAPLLREVALIGHSMGGMIVQAMMEQRPTHVRFAALLSTHAGGLWNLVPTVRLMTGIARIAWSGFDRDVNAAVNLNFHFTQKFLDDWVDHDLDEEEEGQVEESNREVEQDSTERQQKIPVNNAKHVVESDAEHTTATDATLPSPTPSQQSGPSRDGVSCDELNTTKELPYQSVAHHHHGLGYFESKVIDLVRDAQIYFGLTRSFRNKLWKPQKLLLDAIAKHRKRARRRRRRDIYHAKYTGAERSHASHVHRSHVASDSSSSVMTNPEDSPYAIYGHAAVVRSHSLSSTFASRLRECTRVVKLVMTGRHDKVVTPSSSRALATAIGANTVVEVEAAHFITDEAAAEVTTHVIYGLRKAFYARSSRPCECEWCVAERADIGTRLPSCRMC